MADFKQIQQMIPFITCETALWLRRLRVGSHCRTSAFDNHLDYSFIVLKHIQ